MDVAEKSLKEPTNNELDAEYGLKELLKGAVSDKDIDSGKFVHDVNHIDVDINSLTSGDIDWEKAVASMEWMVDKTKEALKEHKKEDVSQFLAKTCIMHVIQCFHHCRHDAPPGKASEGPTPSPASSHVEGSSLSRQPSVTV